MRVHGGGIWDVLDFSVNTNPLGPPKILEEEVARCCKAGVYGAYPDSNYTGLKEAIAYFHSLDEDLLVACNGASEALNLALIALKPRNLLVVSPSYGDYDLLCEGIEAKCRHLVMREVDGIFKFDAGQVVEEVKGLDAVTVVVTNPNNPTGLVVDEEVLIGLAEELDGEAWLILDEVYAELSVHRGLLGRGLENVVVVRSFTKVFGTPGLRLGFAYTASKKLLRRMEAIRPTWNISSIAEATFRKILVEAKEELWSFIRRSSQYIAEERIRLMQLLSRLGCRVYGSEANFLLLKHPWIDSRILRDELLRRYRIHVRSAHTFRGLTRFHIRVAVRKRDENELLVRAFEELAGEV